MKLGLNFLELNGRDVVEELGKYDTGEEVMWSRRDGCFHLSE